MKCVILGDTHRSEWDVEIPDGDILIHTGDFDIYNPEHVDNLNNWFNYLFDLHKFKHPIIFTGGNHDFFFEKIDYVNDFFDNAIYIQNGFIEVEGKKIWASPYTPEFHQWAFMYPRCSEDAKKNWEQIPENLDLLITHGPPYQILDKNREGEHCGCEVLQREVFKKKPKNHVFGHIHRKDESYPRHSNIEGINFYNVSVLDEDYQLAYKPIVLEI